MTALLYDVLDVERTATTEEIRTAWRSAVSDLDPTERRFRLYNEAAEVLLDPDRRASYDEGLAATAEIPAPADSEPGDPDAGVQADAGARAGAGPSARRRVPLVPTWLLVGVAALVALALVGVGVLLTRPADASVADDTRAAQAAAERAIVPVLSYDAHHLARSEASAMQYLTPEEQQQYAKLFAVVKQNAPRLGTVIRARYVSSGIVRSGTDRVDVLVFVDQVTTNQAHPRTPVVFKNQATVSMAKVGGTWLVDGLTTTRS